MSDWTYSAEHVSANGTDEIFWSVTAARGDRRLGVRFPLDGHDTPEQAIEWAKPTISRWIGG